MEKDSGNGVKGGFQFRAPVQRTKWQAIQNAFYDPDTKQYCGRTPKNWGQLLIFYTIFYIVLAALFAICMQGLLATIDKKRPTWTLAHSLIGSNPGLGFRPISNRTEEGSLIWYNPKNKTSVQKWTALTSEFLKPYKDNQVGDNFVNCDFNKKPESFQVCITDVESFGPCSPSEQYSYNTGSPCVFLKLNKIFDWQPEFYKKPIEGMPPELNDTINGLANENEKEQIWVSCEGEAPNDRENVRNFSYYPTAGFPGYFYPYRNVNNYLSPLIAVRVMNPTANVIISIECRAWAENIVYHGGNLHREGSIHFEIMVDDLDS